MSRYKLTIEYDGTGLAGWQRQENKFSVQELIETALHSLTNEKIVIYGSGRTDAGVHARGQVAHVDIDKDFEPFNLIQGVNHYLQDDPVVVVNAQRVDDDFHARFDAVKRYYRYQIVNRQAPLVLDEIRAWHVHKKLDISLMQEGAFFMLGSHDFSSLRSSDCQAEKTVRTIDKIHIYNSNEMIFIDVEAKSFLHHMVRNIVGTLKMVGTGKWNPEKVSDIIDSKDRTKAGPTAPAHGLYFMGVDY